MGALAKIHHSWEDYSSFTSFIDILDRVALSNIHNERLLTASLIFVQVISSKDDSVI